MKKTRKRMVLCWSCRKPFPRTRNPAGRKEQSRILVNCPECRRHRQNYIEQLVLYRRSTAWQRKFAGR